MKIFLAGASGVIGRHLTPLLVDAGHEVVGSARTEAGLARLSEQGARGIRVEMLDPNAVRRAVTEAAPEAVIHQLTALSQLDFAANARLRREATRHLVNAAIGAGVRRIVAQSIAWIYGPGEEPAPETDPLDQDPARATLVESVRSLEAAVAEVEQHVVLRYGLLYGPGTWYFPGGRVGAQLRAGELVADDAVSSFVHVADAARAAVLALSWSSATVNVVDDEPAPARAWMPALAKTLGEPTPRIAAGRAGWQRGASNRLARTLGWTPRLRSWREGFAECERKA